MYWCRTGRPLHQVAACVHRSAADCASQSLPATSPPIVFSRPTPSLFVRRLRVFTLLSCWSLSLTLSLSLSLSHTHTHTHTQITHTRTERERERERVHRSQLVVTHVAHSTAVNENSVASSLLVFDGVPHRHGPSAGRCIYCTRVTLQVCCNHVQINISSMVQHHTAPIQDTMCHCVTRAVLSQPIKISIRYEAAITLNMPHYDSDPHCFISRDLPSDAGPQPKMRLKKRMITFAQAHKFQHRVYFWLREWHLELKLNSAVNFPEVIFWSAAATDSYHGCRIFLNGTER